MPYDNALSDRVTDYFTSRRASFEAKRMMGGLCFMVNGKMCVGVTKERLMVRIDPEQQESLAEKPGVRPMDFTGCPMRGFLYVFPEGYDSEVDLRFWLDRALEFNPKAKASPKAARKSPPRAAAKKRK